MTILYILISTDPYGGATKSFLALLRGVLASGVKVIVVVPDQHGIHDMLKDMGAEVIVQYSKGNTWAGARNFKQKLLYVPRQLGRIYIDYQACRSLIKKLEGKHIDIVHSNNSVTDIGRYVANKLGLPHVFHIREYGDKDFGLHYFPTTSFFNKHLRDDNVYTVCITKDIQKHHGLSDCVSSRVIYNGILEGRLSLPAFNDERKFYLYAGRIEPTKGLLNLLCAYVEYVKKVTSPLTLKVAGEVFDQSYMNQINTFISENKLDDKVEFLGNVTDMSHLYQSAKAIIIPSESEGFGRCMPEAMSNGCIAIGKDTGGTKEQFDNGLQTTGQEVGFRYDTTLELASKLFEVASLGNNERIGIIQRAFNVVNRLYTCEKHVEQILDLYHNINSKTTNSTIRK